MSTDNANKEKMLRFTSLEVKGVQEVADECMVVEDDADADFFSIYGRDDAGLAYCIGDFSTRSGAEFIKEALEAS